MARDLHVVPDNLQGGWDVRVEHRQEPVAHFNTKDQAIAYAREESRGTSADVVVHDEGINTKGPDWVLDRHTSGADLRIYEENEALPPEVRQGLQTDRSVRGIPQGQIQPKSDTDYSQNPKSRKPPREPLQ